MTVKNYNKLVRDLIPDIITASGSKCRTRVLSDEEYLKMLDEKGIEEAEVLVVAGRGVKKVEDIAMLQELADLLELIRAAAIARGYTLDDLEAARAKKAASRGGFEKKIFLIDVTE